MATVPISVVMPVYNGAKHIKECLESILCQSFQGLNRIIVIGAPVEHPPLVTTIIPAQLVSGINPPFVSLLIFHLLHLGPHRLLCSHNCNCMRKLLLLIFIFTSSLAFAQKYHIDGFIRDSFTKEKLDSVNVTLMSMDSTVVETFRGEPYG